MQFSILVSKKKERNIPLQKNWEFPIEPLPPRGYGLQNVYISNGGSSSFESNDLLEQNFIFSIVT